MAEMVDRQNAGNPGYEPMTINRERNVAYLTAAETHH